MVIEGPKQDPWDCRAILDHTISVAHYRVFDEFIIICYFYPTSKPPVLILRNTYKNFRSTKIYIDNICSYFVCIF